MADTDLTPLSNSTSPITNTNIQGVPPPPPRSTGNAQQDLPLLIDWMWRFYSSVVTAQYYLTTSGQQSDPGTFDPSTLPDPSDSSIPQAQQTANNAYVLANAAKVEADKSAALTKNWETGTFTVSGSASTSSISFAADKQQPDTNYKVFLTVANFTGGPVLDSLLPIRQVVTTSGFTITLGLAPGTGASVTYNWLILRGI